MAEPGASGLAEMGFSEFIIEKVLNHQKRSVVGLHYDKYGYREEKTQALNAWNLKLQGIIFGKESKSYFDEKVIQA